MSRPPERLGGGGRISKLPAHQRAVVSRDARRDGRVGRVDRDGVGGRAEVLVVGDHLGEVEGRAAVGEDGGADEPAGVPDHEGHLLGRD